jgi:predicted DsbA family dithiol-disulfide isomerase
MDAYWAEGVDLSERASLERLAGEAGVTPETVSQALDERAWRATVDASTARAQRAGVTGVPAFVIDWKVLVLGAQSREVLADAVAQAHETGSGTD